MLFLGKLGDLAGVDECTYPAPVSWDGLLDNVPVAVASELRAGRVKLACAGCLLTDETLLDARDGDEVALLPPVSGG